MTNQYFHSNIYALTEDKQGRMWMGTRGNGLKVGDTWYYNNPSDLTALSDNNVFAIYRDRKDRMWIGTLGWNWLNLLPTVNINSVISSSKHSG